MRRPKPTPRFWGGRPVARSPRMSTLPSSGSSRPAITRRSVDFPLPLGPRSAVSEPPAIATDTLSRATKSPKRLVTRRTAIDTGRLLSEEVHEEERHEREHCEHDRRRIGTDEVEGLKTVVHVQRERLRLSDEVSGHDRHGSELAQAARCREHHAVRDPPPDRGQRDPAESGKRRRAERPGRLLLLGPDLAQDRDHLADDEGKRNEDRREDHGREGEDDLDPVRAEPGPEPP